MQVGKTLRNTVLRDGSHLVGQLFRSGFPTPFTSFFIPPNHMNVYAVMHGIYVLGGVGMCVFRWGQQEEKERL